MTGKRRRPSEQELRREAGTALDRLYSDYFRRPRDIPHSPAQQPINYAKSQPRLKLVIDSRHCELWCLRCELEIAFSLRGHLKRFEQDQILTASERRVAGAQRGGQTQKEKARALNTLICLIAASVTETNPGIGLRSLRGKVFSKIRKQPGRARISRGTVNRHLFAFSPKSKK